MHLNQPERSAAELDRLVSSFDELAKVVYNYARFRVRDPVTADEITAQTFETAFDRIETYDPSRGSLTVWLLGIARNAAADHFRGERRRRRFTAPMREEVPGRLSRPEQDYLERETREELLAALSRLKPREREIVSLKFPGMLSNREIAVLLGMSEGNVGIVLFRTLRKLKRLMEKTR